MSNATVERCLAPVVQRRRRLRRAGQLAGLWMGWAVLALAGWVLLRRGGFSTGWWDTALIVGVVLSTIWLWRRNARWRPDLTDLARRIEETHPDAAALIQTAVQLRPAHAGSRWSYLQRRVIREALVHAQLHDWSRAISPRRLLWLTLAQVTAFVLLVAALVSIQSGWAQRHWAVVRPVTAVFVEPGDAEVATGASVMVTARFDGPVPQDATLVMEPIDGGPVERRPLQRTLADPVFAHLVTGLTRNWRYHVEFGGRASPTYRLDVYQRPRLVRSEATVVPPAYTGLPVKTLAYSRRLAVLEGSAVTLSLRINKPVGRAELRRRQGPALEVPTEPNRLDLQVTLPTDASEQYELHLIDAAGRTNEVPPRFVLDVLTNARPDLRVTFPGRDEQVSALQEVAVEAQLTDDYGITAYGIRYQLADQPPVERRWTLETPADSVMLQALVELERLRAQPQDLLSYSVWAEDYGPDGRVRRTDSDLFFADVLPFEQRFRESESFQGDAGAQQNAADTAGGSTNESLLELQRQILSATWNLNRRWQAGEDDAAWLVDVNEVRQAQAEARQRTEQAQEGGPQGGGRPPDAQAVEMLRSAARSMEAALAHLNQPPSGTTLQEAIGDEQAALQALLRLQESSYDVTQARGAQAQRGSSSGSRVQRQLRQLDLRQPEDRYETQRLAQSPQQQTRRQEDLRVMNRLRDLAQRQQQISDRLREAEAALRQAENEAQRQEARRRLQRLQEEQQQALDDADRLRERLERPENRQRLAETRRQMEQTRQRMQEAADQMQEGRLAEAAGSTTRAQRGLEQMRDQLRQSRAGQFSDEVSTLRSEARRLAADEQDIAERLAERLTGQRRRLAADPNRVDLGERLARQGRRSQDLLEEMRRVSDAAEEAEPLLSRQLYETVREIQPQGLPETLDLAGQLIDRGFLPDAQRLEQQARQTLDRLRAGIEEAARGVLGSEDEALRLAQAELERLAEQLEREIGERAPVPDGAPPGRRQAGTSGQSDRADPNDTLTAAWTRRADPNRPAPSTRGGQGDPNTPAGPAQLSRLDPNDSDRSPLSGGGGSRTAEAGRTPRRQSGVLTGRDYVTWSDRLRDVEDLLDDPNLRDQAARLRDRARAVRAEFVRHGAEPQWDVVVETIARPLRRLQREVLEELARRDPRRSETPIDRDPVPARYAEAVRRYFESLGQEERP